MTDLSQTQKKLIDRLIDFGYPVLISLLIFISAMGVVIGSKVIYIHLNDIIEPTWLRELANLLGKIGTTTEGSQPRSSYMDALYVCVVGIVSGKFLNTCSSGIKTRHVIFLIFLIIIFILNSVVIENLPAPDELKIASIYKDKLLEYLASMLSLNSNIAIGILSATLGLGLANKKGVN